jgi:hypothetical protein
MMTYITNSAQYFPVGLRVAIMGSTDEDNRFQLALPGKPAFLPFSEITQEQYDELLKTVEDELRPCKQADQSLSDNLVYHVGIIARVIKRASEMSDGLAGFRPKRKPSVNLRTVATGGG